MSGCFGQQNKKECPPKVLPRFFALSSGGKGGWIESHFICMCRESPRSNLRSLKSTSGRRACDFDFDLLFISLRLSGFGLHSTPFSSCNFDHLCEVSLSLSPWMRNHFKSGPIQTIVISSFQHLSPIFPTPSPSLTALPRYSKPFSAPYLHIVSFSCTLFMREIRLDLVQVEMKSNLPPFTFTFTLSHKGPYLNDVCTGGKEGGWSKRDDNTDRLCEWDSDKGGGGKKPKFLRTSYKYSP